MSQTSGYFPQNMQYWHTSRKPEPLTSRTIYKYVVIPKALYDCEMRSTLSNIDIAKLERAHRVCLKYKQILSPNMSNQFTHNIINMGTI